MPTTAGLASGGGYPFSPPMPSVELEPIEPSDTKPPSMLFDRSNLKSFFSSPKVDRVSKRASRFQMGVEPLTGAFHLYLESRLVASFADLAPPLSWLCQRSIWLHLW